jgi:hypothetical protein
MEEASPSQPRATRNRRGHPAAAARPLQMPMVGSGAFSRHLDGIGELTDIDTCWRLVYAACGHIQYLARVGLEDPQRAEASVRRYLHPCLACKAGL